jgi:hypothetical protein
MNAQLEQLLHEKNPAIRGLLATTIQADIEATVATALEVMDAYQQLAAALSAAGITHLPGAGEDVDLSAALAHQQSLKARQERAQKLRGKKKP